MKEKVKLQIAAYDAIFFSPHLDDAVLSQGGNIARLAARGEKILVVTVFTHGQSIPLSKSGRGFLRQCGQKSVREMFEARKKEDQKVARVLGFDLLHLKYDAEIYRLKPKTLINSILPSRRFVYPSFKKVFSGQIFFWDKKLQKKLKKDLALIIRKYGKSGAEIYGPLGVGGHVDHLLIFEALNSLKIKKLLFWEDIPYNKKPENTKKRLANLAKRKLRFLSSKTNIGQYLDLKEKAIRQYASQVRMLFPDGLIVKNKETSYERI